MDGALNGAGSLSQVKIQLSTRDPDLQLPDETGPILVSTSKPTPKYMKFYSNTDYRFKAICPLYSCQQAP